MTTARSGGETPAALDGAIRDRFERPQVTYATNRSRAAMHPRPGAFETTDPAATTDPIDRG